MTNVNSPSISPVRGALLEYHRRGAAGGAGPRGSGTLGGGAGARVPLVAAARGGRFPGLLARMDVAHAQLHRLGSPQADARPGQGPGQLAVSAAQNRRICNGVSHEAETT